MRCSPHSGKMKAKQRKSKPNQTTSVLTVTPPAPFFQEILERFRDFEYDRENAKNNEKNRDLKSVER